MASQIVQIDSRFCGPPSSGNGGYSCGIIGRNIEGASQVRLHSPPPLGADLVLHQEGDEWSMFYEEQLVATAKPATLSLDVPSPPTLEQAIAARERYLGHRVHAYPGCFVCGPARESGDGLRLFTGPVEGTELVACDWTPSGGLLDSKGFVRPEMIWAALDCPSFFALDEQMIASRLFLLGQMTAVLEQPILGKEPLLVMGWRHSVERRKHFSAAAICNAQGDVLAKAQHIWIALKPT